MEPERSFNNGRTSVVHLDTGIYQVNELCWAEFEICNYGRVEAQAMNGWLGHTIDAAVAKSSEDGDPIEYLGRQTRIKDARLEGCLVFARPGNYLQIAKE